MDAPHPPQKSADAAPPPASRTLTSRFTVSPNSGNSVSSHPRNTLPPPPPALPRSTSHSSAQSPSASQPPPKTPQIEVQTSFNPTYRHFQESAPADSRKPPSTAIDHALIRVSSSPPAIDPTPPPRHPSPPPAEPSRYNSAGNTAWCQIHKPHSQTPYASSLPMPLAPPPHSISEKVRGPIPEKSPRTRSSSRAQAPDSPEPPHPESITITASKNASTGTRRNPAIASSASAHGTSAPPDRNRLTSAATLPRHHSPQAPARRHKRSIRA